MCTEAGLTTSSRKEVHPGRGHGRQQGKGKHSSRRGAEIGAAVGGAVVVLGIGIGAGMCWWCVRRRREKKERKEEDEHMGDGSTIEISPPLQQLDLRHPESPSQHRTFYRHPPPPPPPPPTPLPSIEVEGRPEMPRLISEKEGSYPVVGEFERGKGKRASLRLEAVELRGESSPSANEANDLEGLDWWATRRGGKRRMGMRDGLESSNQRESILISMRNRDISAPERISRT